jgi:type II secretory pathway component PulK
MRAYSTSRGRQIIRDTLGATCREGIALVTVLAVLSLLTILTAGSLASTGRLRGGSELAATEGRLLADGEYALNGVILDWGERQLRRRQGETRWSR